MNRSKLVSVFLPLAVAVVPACKDATPIDDTSSSVEMSDAGTSSSDVQSDSGGSATPGTSESSGTSEVTASGESSSSSELSGTSGETTSGESSTNEDTDTNVDPRCALRPPIDEVPDCDPPADGKLWWGVWVNQVSGGEGAWCQPSKYGPKCANPGEGFPFASIEECLAACPEAFNLVADGTKVERCDDGALSTVSRFQEMGYANNVLSTKFWFITGCPTHGPYIRLCWESDDDEFPAGGGRKVWFSLQYDMFDVCDLDYQPYTRSFDLSEFLQNVPERPLTINMKYAEMPVEPIVIPRAIASNSAAR